MKTVFLVFALIFFLGLPRDGLADCCFGIGYGAMMKPCCLSIHQGAQTRDQCIPPNASPMMGGAVGWTAGECPSDPDKANEIIQAMRNDKALLKEAEPPSQSTVHAAREESSRSNGFIAARSSTALSAQKEKEAEQKSDLSSLAPVENQQHLEAPSSSTGMRVENLEAEMAKFNDRLAELESAKSAAGFFLMGSVFLGASVAGLASWWMTRRALASRSPSLLVE